MSHKLGFLTGSRKSQGVSCFLFSQTVEMKQELQRATIWGGSEILYASEKVATRFRITGNMKHLEVEMQSLGMCDSLEWRN